MGNLEEITRYKQGMIKSARNIIIAGTVLASGYMFDFGYADEILRNGGIAALACSCGYSILDVEYFLRARKKIKQEKNLGNKLEGNKK